MRTASPLRGGERCLRTKPTGMYVSVNYHTHMNRTVFPKSLHRGAVSAAYACSGLIGPTQSQRPAGHRANQQLSCRAIADMAPVPRGMLRLAQINLRSWHSKFVTDCMDDIRRSADKMGVVMGGTVPLPTHKRKFSVNRSPFVNSKSQAQVCYTPRNQRLPVVFAYV